MTADDKPTPREAVWNEIVDGSAGKRGDLDRDIDLEKYEFAPSYGRIVFEVFPPDTASRGGIHIPDNAKSAKSWGRVVSVGEGVDGIAPGDLILTIFESGTDLSILAPNHRLVEWGRDFENEVLGVFRQKGIDTGTQKAE